MFLWESAADGIPLLSGGAPAFSTIVRSTDPVSAEEFLHFHQLCLVTCVGTLQVGGAHDSDTWLVIMVSKSPIPGVVGHLPNSLNGL